MAFQWWMEPVRCPDYVNGYSSYKYTDPFSPLLFGWQCLQEMEHILIQIDYCLSKPIMDHCRLELSVTLLLVIVTCNVIKAASLLATLLLADFHPFITVGDAIASFLSFPDQNTKTEGTVSAHDVRHREVELVTELSRMLNCLPQSRAWKVDRYKWFTGASLRRWLATAST